MMAREEAIKELDTFKKIAKSERGEKALDMAIELLTKIPEHHGKLKDVDKIIEELGCEDEAIIFEEILREAPTLIEAESEVDNADSD